MIFRQRPDDTLALHLSVEPLKQSFEPPLHLDALIYELIVRFQGIENDCEYY